MLAYKTVFVIGAGASFEAGLPVGNTLKDTISKKLDLNIDFRRNGCQGDQDILQRLRRSFPNDLHSYVNGAKLIERGIVLSASIDDFIHIHSHDNKIAVCGKLAIAKSILEAELSSKLYVKNDNIYNTINFSSLANTWYLGFYQLLTQGVSRDKIGSIFDKVTLIIFNYDRCVEHFLTHAICQNYLVPYEDAAEIVQSIKIYRPYGSVGNYFGSDKIAFGENHLFSTESVINSLKTYSEELTNTEELEEMRSAIDAALRVVFLGNAYHPNNMKLLFDERFDGQKDVSPKRVFATRRGISDVDLTLVRGSFNKVLYRKLAMPINNDDYFFADSCTDLFNNYRMLLKA